MNLVSGINIIGLFPKKKHIKIVQKSILVLIVLLSFLSLSCNKKSGQNNNNNEPFEESQNQLQNLLKTSGLSSKQKYTIVNQMANNLLQEKDYQGVILFLTDWVENNPDDMYNAYWLLMTAYAYISTGAEPVAEYYFDRILQNYQDLLVQDNSIHFMCLQNLLQISKTPRNRIKYFNELINRFPEKINTTELILRLAMEYENDNQWDQALKSYELFLQQPDASVIQIMGVPDAYKNARHFIDFYHSSKDWTFQSLPELEEAVKKAIRNYDWRTLDKYKAKVNFFSMSWKQDEMDENSQVDFSMKSFMRGNRVRYSDELDESSNSEEAYLRTWGWSQYVSVWYLYFRKINFPVDPSIHGNWEWAGIYIGNKL